MYRSNKLIDDVEPTETERRQNRLHLSGNTATIRQGQSLTNRPWWCSCRGVEQGEMSRCNCRRRTDIRRPHQVPSGSVFLPAPSASNRSSFVVSCSSTNTCTRIYHQSCGLLQEHFRLNVCHPPPTTSVRTQRRGAPDCKEAEVWPHHGLSSWRYRFTYKLCLFVHKRVDNVTPLYLVDQCVPVSMNVVRRGRRSTTTNDNLMYPRTRLVRYGDRSFGIIGQNTLNHLPPELRDPTLSQDVFYKKILKRILFDRAHYASYVRIRDGLDA